MMSESENQSVAEIELETLRSIYVHELVVQYDDVGVVTSVGIQLYPATADNIEEQYVRMNLLFKLPEKYPENIPEICVRNPRGLSDDQINRIIENLLSIAEKRKGASMLFELIEAAKEQLTAENRPNEECAICLYSFLDGDVFTKTECYHYFHSHCLARYVQSRVEDDNNTDLVKMKKSGANAETPCPVCRIPISFGDVTKEFPEPIAVAQAVISMNSVAAEQQNELAYLYEKQLAQGGIIDIEAEKKKFLLEIANVSSDAGLDITESLPPSDSHSVSNEPKYEVIPDAAVSVKSKSTSQTASDNVSTHEGEPVSRRPHRHDSKKHYERNGEFRGRQSVPSSNYPSPKWHGRSNKRHHGKFASEVQGSVERRSDADFQSPENSDQNSRKSPVKHNGPRSANYFQHRNYSPRNDNRRNGHQNSYNKPSYYRGSFQRDRNSGQRNARDNNRKSPVVSDQNDVLNKFSEHSDNLSEGQTNCREVCEESNRNWEAKRHYAENTGFDNYHKQNNYRQRNKFHGRGHANRFSKNNDKSSQNQQESAEVVQDLVDDPSCHQQTGHSNSRRFSRQSRGRRPYNHFHQWRKSEVRNTAENVEPPPVERKISSVAKQSSGVDYHISLPHRNLSNLCPKDARNTGLPRDLAKTSQISTLQAGASSGITCLGTLPCSEVTVNTGKGPVPSEFCESNSKVKAFKERCNISESFPDKCSIGMLRSPPGFANPSKKIVYGLPSIHPPPGFHRS